MMRITCSCNQKIRKISRSSAGPRRTTAAIKPLPNWRATSVSLAAAALVLVSPGLALSAERVDTDRRMSFLSDPPFEEKVARVERGESVVPQKNPGSRLPGCTCAPGECSCETGGDCGCASVSKYQDKAPSLKGDLKPTATAFQAASLAKPTSLFDVASSEGGINTSTGETAESLRAPQFPSTIKGAADVIQEAMEGATRLGDKIQSKEGYEEAQTALKARTPTNDVVNPLSAFGREDAQSLGEGMEKQMEDSVKASFGRG